MMHLIGLLGKNDHIQKNVAKNLSAFPSTSAVGIFGAGSVLYRSATAAVEAAVMEGALDPWWRLVAVSCSDISVGLWTNCRNVVVSSSVFCLHVVCFSLRRKLSQRSGQLVSKRHHFLSFPASITLIHSNFKPLILFQFSGFYKFVSVFAAICCLLTRYRDPYVISKIILTLPDSAYNTQSP